MPAMSVTILGGVIFGGDDQTAPFPCASIYSLNNVDEFLFVLQGPIDLVVVASTKIDHDMLVAEEEHHRWGVIQFIHGVKIRHLGDVH